MNERKYVVYIETQRNSSVYLSSTSIPSRLSSYHLSSSRGGSRSCLSSVSTLSNRSSLGGLCGLLDLRALVLNDLGILLLLPPSRAGKLGLMPRTSVAVLTATLTLALTAEGLGKVLGRDLLEKLALVSGSEDVDLGNGDGVQIALDNAPDSRETPRGVDDIQLAETLGVVVLGDDGSLLDVGVNLRNLADGDTLEVHNSAACLEEVTSLAGASGKTGIGNALVLDSKVLKHTISGGDLVHSVQVDTAKSLDVDWSAILVGLVVELSVVLADLSLLGVVPDRHSLVELGLLSPFLGIQEHGFRGLDIELARSEESKQSQCVQSLGATLGLEHHAELVKLGNLLLCEVTSVAVLLLRALDREIIVVVLGVQIHGE
jgi:hypothetical protein